MCIEKRRTYVEPKWSNVREKSGKYTVSLLQLDQQLFPSI
jgi:hypothetical protein